MSVSISPQDHGGTLASRRSARKEIRRSITRGRERERSLAARAGLNGRLWIPGISGLRRCRASGRDGPVTRAQLVCHRSGDHAGKEQSTECKLAAQPYDAPPIGGTRAPDVFTPAVFTTHLRRDLRAGSACVWR
jgi:hypothetical protein